jgi:hypothetical protein
VFSAVLAKAHAHPAHAAIACTDIFTNILKIGHQVLLTQLLHIRPYSDTHFSTYTARSWHCMLCRCRCAHLLLKGMQQWLIY